MIIDDLKIYTYIYFTKKKCCFTQILKIIFKLS